MLRPCRALAPPLFLVLALVTLACAAQPQAQAQATAPLFTLLVSSLFTFIAAGIWYSLAQQNKYMARLTQQNDAEHKELFDRTKAATHALDTMVAQHNMALAASSCPALRAVVRTTHPLHPTQDEQP